MFDSTSNEPLSIRQQELPCGATRRHGPTQYVLLLIKTGKGHHRINDCRLAYQAGDIFLLFPEDRYSLEAQQHTQWLQLAFTPVYLAGLMHLCGQQWLNLSSRQSPQSCPITANPASQRHIMALADIVLAEMLSSPDTGPNPVINLLMTTVLSLLDRLLTQPAPVAAPQSSSLLIRRMIGYVSQHITEPDNLRIEKMADVFNYSPGHLGAIFKKHAGESIQQYIIRHKLRLVETRLTLSSMTVSQIADEFGFSDVCHLNKLFKRYYNNTPTNYRRCQISQ